MSFFEKYVEYFIARIKAKPFYQKAKKFWQETSGINSAFYFLSLKQGCLLIAFFEALVSLLKICWIYYLVYRSDTKSLFPDPKWVYFMLEGEPYYLSYHYTHYQFHVGRYLITILNSILLFFGVKWSYVAFLYYWLHISLLTRTMEFYNALFNSFKLSQLFLFTLPSLIFYIYILLIVISLIWKIGEKSSCRVQEVEEEGLELME